MPLFYIKVVNYVSSHFVNYVTTLYTLLPPFETHFSLLKSTNIPPAAVRPMPVAARTEPRGDGQGAVFYPFNLTPHPSELRNLLRNLVATLSPIT